MDKDKSENHSQFFKELVQFATASQFLTALPRFQKTIQNLGTQLHLISPQEYKHVAHINILAYVDKQLDMLARFVSEPIECIAWTVRNLYEVSLIVQDIGSDEQKAEKFVVGELRKDELQILKGFDGLNLGNSDIALSAREKAEPLKARIRESLAKLKLKETEKTPTAALADRVGDRRGYKAYFGLYSKYVHPSSWLINGTPLAVDNEDHRRMFLVEALHHVTVVIIHTANIFGLDPIPKNPE